MHTWTNFCSGHARSIFYVRVSSSLLSLSLSLALDHSVDSASTRRRSVVSEIVADSPLKLNSAAMSSILQVQLIKKKESLFSESSNFFHLWGKLIWVYRWLFFSLKKGFYEVTRHDFCVGDWRQDLLRRRCKCFDMLSLVL